MLNGLFPKELCVENFRSLDGVRIPLRVPDGSKGSGLNLFIGENGGGKTSAIQILNLAFQGYSAASRCKISDFRDFERQIKAEVSFDRFKVKPGSQFRQQKKQRYECTGIIFTAESRQRKQPNRLISDPFSSRTNFIADEWYLDERDQVVAKVGGDPEKFDSRDAALDVERIMDRVLASAFLLEKSRARHLGRGQFATTLDRITDEISWNFRREIQRDIIRADDYMRAFKQYEATIQASIPDVFGDKFSDELSGVLGYKLSLNPLIYDSPYGGAHIARKLDNGLRDVPAELLGSGHEMMVAMLLQMYLAEHLSAPLLLMIDEPEMHLHPRLQARLGRLLLEKSSSHQIVVTSHSPYLVQEIGSGANIVRFELRGDVTEVVPAPGLASKLPWGLTMNEVNYLAFEFTTYGYFNELWGAAMIKFGKERVMELDSDLSAAGLEKSEIWRRQSGNEEAVTLPTLVRNTLHHPENRLNRRIAEQDVSRAVDCLRRIL